MPSWILQILLNVILPMAIKLGVPQLVALIPKLPQAVQDIINELVAAIGQGIPKHEALFVAKSKIQEHIDGMRPEIK